MRVWVIGRGYPTKQNNMLGSFELEQAQMLAKHGYEVYYPSVEYESLRQLKAFGFEIKDTDGVHAAFFHLPFGRFIPKRLRKGLCTKVCNLLYKYLIKKHGLPDVIHVHYPSLFPYSMFEPLQKKGVKLVGTEHYTKVQNKTINEEQKQNVIDYVKHYDEVLCVGENLAKSIKELAHTNREIIVVPNIVSEDFAYRDETEDGFFRFVGVGRLVECKRFDLLIRAFASEFRGNERIKLDIIGGGKQFAVLKQLIHDCGCGEQITLMGVMDRKEVAEYYHKCNALVMSSNLETFGVPIIEAMASGLPVITTDAMGFPSLFHKEHGYIIPMDNEEALAYAMRKMYEDYSGFDRKAIRKYAIGYFSEDVVFHQLDAIYHSAFE